MELHFSLAEMLFKGLTKVCITLKRWCKEQLKGQRLDNHNGIATPYVSAYYLSSRHCPQHLNIHILDFNPGATARNGRARVQIPANLASGS